MATATISKWNGANNIQYSLEVWQSSQSVSNNSSVVKWRLKVWAKYNIQSSNYIYAKVNGNVVYSRTPYLGGSGTLIDTSGSKTVHHNSDGSKSIPIYIYVNTKGYPGGTGEKSATLTLSTIPRATQISVPGSIYVGENKELPLNRKSSSYSHICWWRYHSSDLWTRVASSASTSWNLTVPTEEAGKSYPNSSSFKIDLSVRTMNGSTQIGSDSNYYEHNVYFKKETFRPNTPTLNCKIVNDNGYAGSQWIEGYGHLEFTTSATGKASATIKSYRLRELQSDNSWRTIGTNSSGKFNVYRPNRTDAQFKIDVVDSRGFDSPWSNTVKQTYTPYVPPNIETVSESRNGRNITITVKGQYQYTTDANCGKTEVRLYKGDSLLTRCNMAKASYSSGTYTAKLNTTQEIYQKQDYRIEVYEFGKCTATSNLTVLSEETILSWPRSGKGVTVGRVATEDGFNVYYPAKFHGATDIDEDNIRINGNPLISDDTIELFKSLGWRN